MTEPDYENSIVNLSNSIIASLGGKPHHKPLKLLKPQEFEGKNIVLIVIDGLGYEFLKKRKKSFLWKNLKGKITSVFPSSTAPAITSFLTGLTPKEHAMTGWFMAIRELGMTGMVLPFVSRPGRLPLEMEGAFIDEIIDKKSIFEEIKADSYSVLPDEIAYSSYTAHMSKEAEILPHTNISEMFERIEEALKRRGKKRKFVYAYWPEFDHIRHEKGASSKESVKHFRELDKKFEKFIKRLKNKDTKVIVTADHGFIDTSPKKTIYIEDHPKLRETLVLPLCAGPRTVFCYVRPGKTKKFRDYIRKKLKKYCSLYTQKQLLKKGWFGPGKENPKLFQRIGDYIIVMKKNYTMQETLLGENKKEHLGMHGGLSPEEMLVPVCVIEI